MPTLSRSVPKYRRHKASGQAVVTIQGKDRYLGPWKSKASKLEYDRLIGEWLAAGRPTARVANAHSDRTVIELAAAYWQFAQGYYVKDGKPTDEQPGVKVALRWLKQHYGHTAAIEFGPLALKAIQRRMINEGYSRKYINHTTGRIKRIFKWAAAEELLPVTVHQALLTMSGLKKGKSKAREPEPIGPVSDELVDATLPHLLPIVADMVRLQRLTGARPAEICCVRPCDIDRKGAVWAYRPFSHKTEHHGKQRIIFMGPKAQAILLPYLLRDAEAFCFQTKRPGKSAGRGYTHNNYHRAIFIACDKANVAAVKATTGAPWCRLLVPRWAPNRLRHSAATEIRTRYGLEAASTVLGHAKADVTQIYAERDMAKAAAIMAEVG